MIKRGLFCKDRRVLNYDTEACVSVLLVALWLAVTIGLQSSVTANERVCLCCFDPYINDNIARLESSEVIGIQPKNQIGL